MAGRRDIEAGKAYVTLYARDSQLVKGLERASQQFKKFGGSVRQIGSFLTGIGAGITGPFLAAVAQLDEGKKLIGEIGKDLSEALGRPLLPILQQVRQLVASFRRLAENNPGLIRAIFLIGAGITAAGVAAVFLGGAITAIGSALGIAATVAGFLVTPIGATLAIVVLLVAAVGAGVVAWLRFTDSGKAAFAALTAAFAPFAKLLRDAIGGIGDALAGGDLQLAAKIGATGIKAVFFEAIAAIVRKIADVAKAFLQLFNGLPEPIKRALGNPVAGLTTLIDANANALKGEADRLKQELADLRAKAAALPKGGRGGAIDSTFSEVASKAAFTTGAAVALGFSGSGQSAFSRQQIDLLKLTYSENRSMRRLLETLVNGAKQRLVFGP